MNDGGWPAWPKKKPLVGGRYDSPGIRKSGRSAIGESATVSLVVVAPEFPEVP